MMGCHMSYQTLMRPGSVFSSQSRRQMALNGLRQAIPKLEGGLWGWREGRWVAVVLDSDRSHNVVFGSAQGSDVTDHSWSRCCIH